jgi:uncharacterized protein YegJ (DUF2314 family)
MKLPITALLFLFVTTQAVPTPVMALTLTKPEATSAQQPDDKVIEISEDDKVMNAASAKARETLPEFLAVVRKVGAPRDDIVFKYPLGGWEHILVGNVAIDGEYLTGALSNIPVQTEYKMGDAVRVPMKDVSDWAYRDDKGVMQGHRTTRVLLDKMDPAEAKAIKEYFGW